MIKILSFAFACLFCLCSNLYALGTGTTNGMSYTLIETDGVIGIQINQFDSYTLGTANTYVYNDSGSTTNTAGSYKTLPFEFKSLCLDITSLNDAGTTTVGIFAANGTTDIWSTYSETTYSGTQSTIITLSIYPEYMRAGIKRSGTSSASVTLKELYLRKRN